MQTGSCLLWFYILLQFLLDALSPRVLHYETLVPSDISAQRHHGPDGRPTETTTVSFTALHQRFTLSLLPDPWILHPDAVATLVDENGNETTALIHRDKMFSGTANGDSRQRVTAVQVGDVWIIHIRSPGDLFSVEPLSWYRPGGKPGVMVAYKGWRVMAERFWGMEEPEDNGWDSGRDSLVERWDSEGRLENPKTDTDSPGGARVSEKQLKTPETGKERPKEDADIFREGTNSIRLNKDSPSKSTSRKSSKLDEGGLRMASILGGNLDVLISEEKTLNNSEQQRNFNREHGDDWLSLQENTGDNDARANRSDSAGNATLRHKRGKRSTGSDKKEATECDLLAIVDYKLFRQFDSDFRMVISVMAIVYKYADAILRRTKFGDHPSCGIVLKEVRIHTGYSKQTNHYNAERLVADDAITLLDVMRNSTDSHQFFNFCLVHLNCRRAFSPTVAGMAYYAQALKDVWSAGVCGVYFDRDLRPSPSNVLLTTNTADVGMDLIEYALVVTHELGHAWGSHHDPRDGHCHGAGHFVMDPITLDKAAFDSVRFSQCSRKAIATLLSIRREMCFLTVVPAQHICGDGRVSITTEDCDPGVARRESDPCCAANCTFKAGAQCSPVNDPCCTARCELSTFRRECKSRPSSRDAGCYRNVLGPCTGSGSQTTCPPASTSPLADGTSCMGGQGRCYSGRCMSHCENLGHKDTPPRHLVPCDCEKGEKGGCRVCCREAGKATCEVVKAWWNDGSPCRRGVCVGGTCWKNRSDVTRLLDEPADQKQQQTDLQAMSLGAVCAAHNSLHLAIEVIALTFWHYRL